MDEAAGYGGAAAELGQRVGDGIDEGGGHAR